MKLEVPKGCYVVAVSGGVDSMALLDMLNRLSEVELVVAHFNHGIRKDSPEDEKLVTKAAKKYDLPVEIGQDKLGKNISEEKARSARYEFLREVMKSHGANSIITAHHQDDLIETAFINILRGTGRRGLTAIAQNPDVLRPLLGVSKADLIKYAKKHNLRWREDESNKDTRYLRNYIRLKILPKLSNTQRKTLLADINKLNKLNPFVDQQIATLSQTMEKNGQINRQKFIDLPPEVASEVVAYVLRKAGIRQIDKKLIERLCIAIKTAKAGTKHNVMRGVNLEISHNFALLRLGVES